MKQRSLLIIAVGCGLACATCIALFLANAQGEANAARAEALARYGGEQVEVCVAARDIGTGERVDASAIETRMWIADLLPEEAMRDVGEVIGLTASSPILKGEAISARRFAVSHDALDVPPGKEAVSVPAKAVQAAGGAIRPGMRIDVYASGDSSTVALAQGVVVLDTSLGDAGSLVSSDSGWITLALDPDKVQEVIAASNTTSLSFVVPGDAENTGDGDAADEGGIVETDLEEDPFDQGGSLDEARSSDAEATREEEQ